MVTGMFWKWPSGASFARVMVVRCDFRMWWEAGSNLSRGMVEHCRIFG
jgi:hypothetical protein